MILEAILCVKHFCSFGAMSLIVILLTKTDSTVICVPCMLEHVCHNFIFFKIIADLRRFRFHLHEHGFIKNGELSSNHDYFKSNLRP